jgi:hypothetical protein
MHTIKNFLPLFLTLLVLGGLVGYSNGWFAASEDSAIANEDTPTELRYEVTFFKTLDGVDWHTYTNYTYGYAISYPETMKLNRSSSPFTNISNVANNKLDPVIALGAIGDTKAFTIGAGVERGSQFTDVESMYNYFIEQGLNNMLQLHSRNNRDLNYSDYEARLVNFGDVLAVEIQNPIAYTLGFVNAQQEGFFINALGYDPDTPDPRNALTEEILKTFRVLE